MAYPEPAVGIRPSWQGIAVFAGCGVAYGVVAGLLSPFSWTVWGVSLLFLLAPLTAFWTLGEVQPPPRHPLTWRDGLAALLVLLSLPCALAGFFAGVGAAQQLSFSWFSVIFAGFIGAAVATVGVVYASLGIYSRVWSARTLAYLFVAAAITLAVAAIVNHWSPAAMYPLGMGLFSLVIGRHLQCSPARAQRA